MPQFAKHFTVEEANALLPEIREVLREIQTSRNRLVVSWEEAAPVLKAARLNGGGQQTGAYLGELQRLNRRVRRLIEMGVQLKDVDRGLVDFPSMREGKEVLLCWHVGEERVAFYHDLESGFTGRKPL